MQIAADCEKGTVFPGAGVKRVERRAHNSITCIIQLQTASTLTVALKRNNAHLETGPPWDQSFCRRPVQDRAFGSLADDKARSPLALR